MLWWSTVDRSVQCKGLQYSAEFEPAFELERLTVVVVAAVVVAAAAAVFVVVVVAVVVVVVIVAQGGGSAAAVGDAAAGGWRRRTEGGSAETGPGRCPATCSAASFGSAVASCEKFGLAWWRPAVVGAVVVSAAAVVLWSRPPDELAFESSL